MLSSRISSKMLPSLFLLAASTRGVVFDGSEAADSDEVPSAGSEASDMVLLSISSIFLASAINASFTWLEVSAFAKYLYE